MGAPMNPTDAANVAAFLVRQIESGHGSPEAIASLQRVVDYLNGLIKRLTDPVGDGGPAFPVVELDRVTGNPCDQHFGLSTRDYFAAKAMQGFAMDPDRQWSDGLDGMAKQAYRWADAMLIRGRAK